MENHNLLGDESGFTLIEVICVLIILGVMSAVAVPKYIELEEDAKNRAVDAGIAELNGREKLMWARFLLLDGGYTDDEKLFESMKTEFYDLGDSYSWSKNDPPDENKPPPKRTSGTLKFQTMKIAVTLMRIPSDRNSPAIWVRDNTMVGSQ